MHSDSKLYIHGEVRADRETDRMGNGEGYVETRLSLFDVDQDESSEKKSSKKQKISEPKSKLLVKFLLEQSFQETERQNKLLLMMPLYFNS